MDPERPQSSSGIAPAVKWASYAGLYGFLCGILLLVPLGVVARTLVEVLAMPPALTVIVIPGSGAIVAAIVWWAVVERRAAYTYPFGGVAGLVTVVGTVLLWMTALVVVYGSWTLRIRETLLIIGLVVAVAAPVGAVAGLPLMYARRQLGSGA